MMVVFQNQSVRLIFSQPRNPDGQWEAVKSERASAASLDRYI